MDNKNENDLNAVSLGNIDAGNINDVPSAASAPVETLDVNPPLEPVQPISYEVPEAINNTPETPFINDIGTVPPINNIPSIDNNNPKKKGGNKLIFIIIIVLLLAAVGVGVYIFLNTANNKTKVVLKEVNIEVGEEISTNINDYASNASTCSLNTTGIGDTNVLGSEYTYTITCKDTVYTGKVKIVDTKAPEVKLKDVEIGINEELKIEDFIDTCTDSTECIYSYKDPDTVSDYLKAAGEYEVVIIVKDTSDNQVEEKAKLVVSENKVAELYLNCSKDDVVTKLGLANNEFIKSGIKVYTYKLDSTTYNSLKEQYGNSDAITYEEVSGKPSFNDTLSTLTITKEVTYQELVSEAGNELPSSGGDLKSFYNNLGYSCTIGY